MTEFIKLPTPEQTIQIGFTDQKVSGQAGLLTFAGCLHWHRFGELQAHVAHLRRDAMLPALLASQRIRGSKVESRPYQRRQEHGHLPAAVARGPGAAARGRPSGGRPSRLHSLGCQTLFTCLQPLLAVLEKAKRVVGFWLRPGHARSANNVIAFTLDLLAATCRSGCGFDWCRPTQASASRSNWTCWNRRSFPTSSWRGLGNLCRGGPSQRWAGRPPPCRAPRWSGNDTLRDAKWQLSPSPGGGTVAPCK